jgi:DEAD/DEAH box helicase domain-containing protein
MSLSALLSRWRTEPRIFENITEWRSFPARAAQFVPLPGDLHPYLSQALLNRGYRTLYSHQRTAWELVKKGLHPVIVTGTASGKTLAYNLPVLNHLLQNPEARSLYVFPTKALAQDQVEALHLLLDPENQSQSIGAASPVPVAVYDGDTPSNARPTIRAVARLVITNPDMLHAGILPHHAAWSSFFQNLHFVVIDEMHTYRGVFGSHIANLLRRLKRVARFYGSRPQFILTSATIANPLELAERLVEEPVSLIDEDGAPRGPRHFLVYNPPIVDPSLGLRRSALLETVNLAEDLLHYDVQTIVFGRARRTVEIILTYMHKTAELGNLPGIADESGEQIDEIRGYRSGYLPKQRREIERGLRRGEVRAVVATNALELGVDIGGMGAAILAGYPGTIASTWQQVGRAGRSDEASLALLVTTANPLDQFLANHPSYFFSRSPEHALINPDNILILLAHLRCAAFELPFKPDETFGMLPKDQLDEFLEFLMNSGVLHLSGDKYFWMSDTYPAESVSLRSASANRVILQTVGDQSPVTLGVIDIESAPYLVHPQAIYLHEAQTYHVDELDLDRMIAKLRPVEVDYYTESRSETTVALLKMLDEKETTSAGKPVATISYGDIDVTTQVVGYRKVKWFTHEVLGLGELSLPPTNLLTTGYWLSLKDQIVEDLRQEGLWLNDPNQYGPNWNAQKELARARDGYRCQMCNAVEHKRAHDVHHKIPFRAFSNYLEANRLENLITLCPVCHRKAELAVRMRSGLSGVAYALGNLAPFFLMCDSRDLGVHSDPHSQLAGGKPAVVIFDLIPAGIGFSQRLFEMHEELVSRAKELVRACECTDGCPSCIGPAGERGYGGKREALAILEKILGEDPRNQA